ncbi:F0F1 ATP synthase subunit gamma [Solimonas flava]|uniref:F0F1 ATP synthase subunit gamma n=1 Tax=Solimonas flava TaxID=415849 RepID=UPI0004289F42|nr:FoF1 ATP synthase subunit gamma [Solimonas flava]
MSERYTELEARIAGVEQFGTVVSALRGIAVTYAQQGRQRLAGVSRYADTVAEAIALALSLQAPAAAVPPAARRGPPALLLFCAEQGFAGAFSEQVFDAAPDAAQSPLLVVGRRGLRVAAARGLTAAWSVPMIAQPDGVARLAERIALELVRRVGGGETVRAEMLYTQPAERGGTRVERRSLLPLDLRRFGAVRRGPPPLIQLPPALLLRRLAEEYLRAELASAILHSFTAENVARMTAMSAARDNIDSRLDALQREARRARQDEITSELIELAAGAEAQRTPA